MWNLKYEFTHEIETDLQTYRTDLWLLREEVGGGNELEVRD